MNVPVVASRVGGIPEIIVDGHSGLLVPAGDPHILAEKIVDLLMDPDKRKRLAANLNQRVLEHFTWRRAYDQYCAVVAGLATD